MNDRSSMPPVSVTMQPAKPVVLAPPDDAGADEVELLVEPVVGAELLLLPHAATASVADTASAAAAHALYLTITSEEAGGLPASQPMIKDYRRL